MGLNRYRVLFVETGFYEALQLVCSMLPPFWQTSGVEGRSISHCDFSLNPSAQLQLIHSVPGSLILEINTASTLNTDIICHIVAVATLTNLNIYLLDHSMAKTFEVKKFHGSARAWSKIFSCKISSSYSRCNAWLGP